MPTAKVYSLSGQQTGEQNLSEKLFNAQPKPSSIHQSIKRYLNNQRQGTHSTLTRAEVSGGGAKPWRQKGTGRARSGSSTSPVWSGGGRAFGPKPRDYDTKIPKKMKRQAVLAAFTLKVQDDRLLVVESPNLDKPQTKAIVKMLEELKITGNKILFLNSGIDRNLELSCRNVAKLTYKRASLASIYDIIGADYLILTPSGLKECEEVFGK
jgi:large subunit ribosomal protein L4